MVLENFWGQLASLLDSWSFKLLFVLLVLILTSVVARAFNYIIKKYFNSSSIHLNVDRTRFAFMSRLITAIIYIVGVAVAASAIPPLRTLSVSLLTGAGVLAAVIGFASQQAMSNIINGVFIAMYKPFSVGDRIRVNEVTGDVEDITLRHTVIKNFENQRIIVPNGVIGNASIINYSFGDPRICKHIHFGISYDSDLTKAIKILKEEVQKNPLFLDIRSNEEKNAGREAIPVHLLEFGESSINLRVDVWVPNPNAAFHLKNQLNVAVKKRFDQEGIEIPYPYRTVVFKKDADKDGKISSAEKISTLSFAKKNMASVKKKSTLSDSKKKAKSPSRKKTKSRVHQQ